MSASITLASFARNPRKALRRIPSEGLVLTRPGEPALRVTLAESGAVPVAAAEPAVPAPVAEPAPVAPSTAVEDEAAAVDEAAEAADLEDDLGASETPETYGATETSDIARAALALLPRAQFISLVSERNSWLESVPPAVRRMVLDDVEAARQSSHASLSAIDSVLRDWEQRSSAFTG